MKTKSAGRPPRAHAMQERYQAMFCNDMGQAETAEFLGKLDRDSWPPRSYIAADWRYEHLDRTPASYVMCLRDGILPVAWQEKFAGRLRAQHRVRIDAGHQAMNSRRVAQAPHSAKF